METGFVVIFTFLYFLQRFGTSGNTMVISSSNVTCIQRERHSLLVFKQSLIDRNNFLSTWRGVECCEWHGVGCDSQNGHVVKLDLRAPVSPDMIMFDGTIQLEGTLSHSLKNLKHLRYLDLSMNGFLGNIPKFLGSFKYLEYLDLSSTRFRGAVPHHLGNLSRLQYLDLRRTLVIHNTYSDHQTIPDYYFGSAPTVHKMDNLRWVTSLSSLTHLDFSGITIGDDIDWFHPINSLSSLITLNLADCDIIIPSIEFVNFTSLVSLDLSLNFINSTIPVWLSNLTGLMQLNLQDNQFHGEVPGFFGMFDALAFIKLSRDFFDTLIPDHLYNLSTLIHLDLSGNMFSGHIPANLGLILSLENLYLHSNQLSGNIPLSLGKLSNLKNLDLSSNSLVGVISETHFTMLNNLNNLVLSSNSLEFNFNSLWIPPFRLQVLYAASCNIGPHFPNWLKTQTNLQRIDLYNSSIIDTIPEWFESILSHILELDLSNNQIGGKIPRIHFNCSNQTEGGILKLNSNKFEGSIATFPSNVRFLDLSDNLLSGNVPQTDGTMNPSLKVVNLSKNRFAGRIPLHLCKVLSIQILDLSQNNFSRWLPRCLGKLINLYVIDLGNNNISGGVPSSLGYVKYLYSLHLQNNRFEGNIPASLQKLTELVTLDIGNNLFMGTIPFWIGEKLSKLKLLNLQLNKFTGKIPLRLCQLKALRFLNLAHNNITGKIPRCFGKLRGMIKTSADDTFIIDYEENILTSMKGMLLLYTKTIQFLSTLDLSNNKIVREIPEALMYLVGLKNLNLSGNLLKGQIPMRIGNLKQLESLDLSMNNLSGRIPQSLTILHFLSFFNLSFNNLSGPIPVGNQLQTLSDVSMYEGNNGLCGPPVSRSCNENGVADHNHASEDEGQDASVDVWFYVGMGPGFVVGFMGLLGSLRFFTSRRLAYFETLEKVYNWLRKSILLNLAGLRRKVFE
ncbi:receptor-like protein EIX2 [Bidens hawaiensis]|uniref:receptor-like protein EIX2 n=1 Tax=Bidens hawaiensis TaxID=980011 RepID=UPI00404A9027